MAAPMARRLPIRIQPQPDDTACGPTCLQAVYSYYGLEIPLGRLVREVPRLAEGGTLAVLLACDALRRGFRATIYTYNLQVFDPTWFRPPGVDLADRLLRQLEHKSVPKLHEATRGYLDFLALGGLLRMEDLTRGLIRRYLARGVPILTGLSATFLYRVAREFGPDDLPDDVRGEPAGHFVVLHGYDARRRTVTVADPLRSNPISRSSSYALDIDRILASILLGNLTYDANFLLIEPRDADPHRRQ